MGKPELINQLQFIQIKWICNFEPKLIIDLINYLKLIKKQKKTIIKICNSQTLGKPELVNSLNFENDKQICKCATLGKLDLLNYLKTIQTLKIH